MGDGGASTFEVRHDSRAGPLLGDHGRFYAECLKEDLPRERRLVGAPRGGTEGRVRPPGEIPRDGDVRDARLFAAEVVPEVREAVGAGRT